jgi:hypothetical protein
MYPPSHIKVNSPKNIAIRAAIQKRIPPLKPVEAFIGEAIGAGADVSAGAAIAFLSLEDISVGDQWKKRRAKDTLQSEKPDGRKIL